MGQTTQYMHDPLNKITQVSDAKRKIPDPERVARTGCN